MFSSGVLVVTLTLSFTVSEFLIFSVNETKVYWPDEILLATDAPCILYLIPLLFNITIASYKSISALKPISDNLIYSSALVSSSLVGTTKG